MELEKVLQHHFGYTSFRPGQKEVIEQIVKGKDVIALLPTGMGKSLCYQLPGYIFNKPVLIISPLLSLMQDQVDQIKQLKEKRVVALNSFLNATQKKVTIQHLHQYRFIFISPEMLLQPQVQQKLNSMELSLIVVDEAHCISQWGFDFRPDYLRIGEVMDKANRPPILALSATATQKVLGDIESYLKMNEPFTFIHTVDRPNIHMGRVLFQNREEKLDWILEHVLETAGPGIIYTQSRSKTESISERLLQMGISTAAYHGGKDTLDRQFIQQQFIDGSLEWIVATNAFGMGVHKQNVRQIIHESIPSNVANYMQEIGRAGRDGKDALAILLFADGDDEFAKFVGIDDFPNEVHVDLYLEYRRRNESPSTMIQNGEISETAYRVLDYWMHQIHPNEVKHQLLTMKTDKIRAVEEVVNLIRTKSCMREKLVHYFGQNLMEKPSDCCECCGLDYHNIIQKRESFEQDETAVSWKKRLETILLGFS
ncbi:RecQ family ATP-dependent DNA helicase [Ureibacillus sp. 179-F W5.1 NHS]|uniref:ATP-dependent DNA helicase RecQ n=1 Tax=Lysinibacillus halotolerans TaxID=1368476 RepID=A0A3M8H591_9BACI|nr:RecQ family ATP-dependent DNA helicase [Lysinibacillus halotolerans]RNC97581.1 ATP-dependent DNA helicase RecQ [Lysinibacillus halotolerans]